MYIHTNDKTTFYLVNICPKEAETDKIDATSMLTKMGHKGPIFLKFIGDIQNFSHRVDELFYTVYMHTEMIKQDFI